MRLNIGTLKIINFPFETNGKLTLLYVTILDQLRLTRTVFSVQDKIKQKNKSFEIRIITFSPVRFLTFSSERVNLKKVFKVTKHTIAI